MEIAVPELPINVLSVPGARITVQVTVPDRPALKLVLPAEKIVENLQLIEANLQIERRNRYMAQQHTSVYRTIVEAIATDAVKDEAVRPAVAVAALWCAVNHPLEHDNMRRDLGTHLRSSQRGFVSLEAFADGRVAIAVALDPAQVSEAQMERAKDDAVAMNEEGRAARAKSLN